MLYTPLKSNIYLSGMSCISCKEIAFLALPLDSVGGSWGGGLQHPPKPPSCSYFVSLPSLGILRYAQKVFLVFYQFLFSCLILTGHCIGYLITAVS